jgi:sortase (surface protein transpeptidase)
MAKTVKEITEKMITTFRRHKSVATVVVFVLALGIGVALMYSPRFHDQTVEAPTVATSTVSGITMSESEPVRLIIPKVKIDALFSKPLGLKANREIEVPDDYTSVGYYKLGPTPGELGPAVILGHVDSFEGPAVLFSLGQLELGDEIRVERADGTVAIFAVTEMDRQPQSEFPTKKVYSDTDHAGLRVITCTGVYDHGSLRYSHNLIVFAKLVSTSTVEKE